MFEGNFLFSMNFFIILVIQLALSNIFFNGGILEAVIPVFKKFNNNLIFKILIKISSCPLCFGTWVGVIVYLILFFPNIEINSLFHILSLSLFHFIGFLLINILNYLSMFLNNKLPEEDSEKLLLG